MNIIGWIREGDSASCHGTVRQGHPAFTSHGRALAHHGSPMDCRKNCTVIAGDHNFTLPDGQPQALHSDKTSGGCPLMSTLNGIHGIGDPSGAAIVTSYFQQVPVVPVAAEPTTATLSDESWLPGRYDDRYVLLGTMDDKPLANTAYAVEREDGTIEHGVTDDDGHTHLLSQTLETEHVRIYLERNA